MAQEADKRGQPCSSSCPDNPWSLVRRPINTQDHKREIRFPIYKGLSHHSGCPGRHEMNRHKTSLEPSSSNNHCFLKKKVTPCPRDPRGLPLTFWAFTPKVPCSITPEASPWTRTRTNRFRIESDQELPIPMPFITLAPRMEDCKHGFDRIS